MRKKQWIRLYNSWEKVPILQFQPECSIAVWPPDRRGGDAQAEQHSKTYNSRRELYNYKLNLLFFFKFVAS